MNDKKKQKEFWGNFWQSAPVIDNFEKPVSQWIFGDKIKFAYLTKFIPPKPAKTLEVGCGSATISLLLSKKGYQTTMVDFADNALLVAKRRFQLQNTTGEFVNADAQALPFADNTFDLVMSFGLLEHFENPQKTISEMVRVLKPGGRFFSDIITKRFSVLTVGKIISFLIRFPYHLIIKFNPAKAFWDYRDLFKPDFYENSFSSGMYEKFMEKGGLLNVKIIGFMPLPPLYVPPWMEKIYIRVLEKFTWISEFFTNSSKLSLFWCVSWIAFGIKNENRD